MEQEHLSDENTSLERRNRGISNGVAVISGVVLAIVVVGVTLFLYSIRTVYIVPEEMDEDITQIDPTVASSAPLADDLVSDATTNKCFINGHEYVDLGLSVKWATCNVGASSPSGYGDYYAWGGKKKMKKNKEGYKMTYKRDGVDNIEGNGKYDVARAKWGDTWRLPTASEMDELINKCTLEWTVLDGRNGYKVIGPNGSSIFLPAAGFWVVRSPLCVDEKGFYWTGTPDTEQTSGAYYIFFDENRFVRSSGGRIGGQSIRPVSE